MFNIGLSNTHFLILLLLLLLLLSLLLLLLDIFRHAHAYIHQVAQLAARLFKKLRLAYFISIADASHESSADRSCGYNAINSRLRIVGGVYSRRGMWPWQIGLYIKHGGGRNISSLPLIYNKLKFLSRFARDKKVPEVSFPLVGE